MDQSAKFIGKFHFDKPLTESQKDILRKLKDDHTDCYEWVEDAIENYIKPWGFTMNGCVRYEIGEDRGTLEVVNNNLLPF